MENKKLRLDYLDYAKGLGIILVVLGHIYAYHPRIGRGHIVVWIYSFHMPLFFIISGMLMKHKNTNLTKKFFKSRVKGLVIPYVFFCLINSWVKMLLYGFNIKTLYLDIIYIITGIGVDMWFLQTLFFAEIFFAYINKIFNKESVKIGVILVVFISGILINKDTSLVCIYITRITTSVGFIAIGYYLYDFISNISINNKYLILLLILQVILANNNGYVDLNNGVFNNIFLYVFNSILGSVIIVLFFKNTRLKLNILKFFGLNSLIIFGFHGNLIYLFRRFVTIALHGYLGGLILLTILMIIQFPIIIVINKYLPFIIGKKYKVNYLNNVLSRN